MHLNLALSSLILFKSKFECCRKAIAWGNRKSLYSYQGIESQIVRMPFAALKTRQMILSASLQNLDSHEEHFTQYIPTGYRI